MAEPNNTEKATPQRRKKAREQGQVVRSREFGSLVALVSALLVLSSQASAMAAHWTRFYNGLLCAASNGDLSAGGPVLFWTTIEVLRWTIPAMLVALLCSVGITLAQGGFNIAPEALSPKFERLNPASRFKQIISFSSVGGLLRSYIPFLVIAGLALSSFHANWTNLSHASGQGAGSVTEMVLGTLRSIVCKSALVLLMAAAADYLLIWRQSESKLRMSHDEIKRENKENEGNPFTKAQLRKRQRAMRARKPLEAAATATMVITNPTHFAIALRYDGSMAAPEVVAKGQDVLAQKIKSIAAENNVPMIENRPLARALYKSVDVGHTIPPELYQAVAEILVAVFRAQDEIKRRNQKIRTLNAAGEVMEPS